MGRLLRYGQLLNIERAYARARTDAEALQPIEEDAGTPADGFTL
jgi:hypothetical protein